MYVPYVQMHIIVLIHLRLDTTLMGPTTESVPAVLVMNVDFSQDSAKIIIITNITSSNTCKIMCFLL